MCSVSEGQCYDNIRRTIPHRVRERASYTLGGAPDAKPCTGAHWEQGEGWEPAGWGSHATCEPLSHATCGLGVSLEELLEEAAEEDDSEEGGRSTRFEVVACGSPSIW